MLAAVAQPAPLPPPSRLQELFSWGGLAIAFMLGVLVASAFWSVMRRRGRLAAPAPGPRPTPDGRDPWAEAGQRVIAPTSDDLSDQHP